MNAPFFTVFTPTYNRRHTLPRVYDCLRRQAFGDFEWIVVDDGSTDDTETLVQEWARTSPFPIRYFRQEHGHKKIALNKGVREALGTLFVCLDSDDTLTEDALQIFFDEWTSIPEPERQDFVGVRCLCADERGQIVGPPFPTSPLHGNWIETAYKARMMGGVGAEKLSADRVDILALHPFPEDFSGYVPEGVVQTKLALRYKARMVNRVVRIYYSSNDAITRVPAFEQNATGMTLWTREVLTHELRWFRYAPVWFLRVAANHTRFHLHTAEKGRRKSLQIANPAGRALAALLTPVGLLLYKWDRRRVRRAGDAR